MLHHQRNVVAFAELFPSHPTAIGRYGTVYVINPSGDLRSLEKNTFSLDCLPAAGEGARLRAK